MLFELKYKASNTINNAAVEIFIYKQNNRIQRNNPIVAVDKNKKNLIKVVLSFGSRLNN